MNGARPLSLRWRNRGGRALAPASAPPSFALQRWVFLRALGAVYLLAFLSLATQVLGLVGSDGILPAADYLAGAYERYGWDAYRLFPTLAWFSSSDLFLQALAWGGVVLAVLLVAGIAQLPVLVLLWACYLSLSVAGQVFLGFQWDALLLETGLLACFYAPAQWSRHPLAASHPPAAIRWLLWWLLFRLYFLSGITKILSGDPAWANWSALTYHYETQPIPAWTSWYAHHLPDWLHGVSVGGMYAMELAVPFLIFVPSRYRAVRVGACGLLASFQLLIAGTGNYGFFNLLAIVLCLTLLDDEALGAFLPGRISQPAPGGPRVRAPGPVRRALTAGFTGLILLTSSLTVVRELLRTTPGGPGEPPWMADILGWVAPFRSVNGYGLFRVMTTERPEIVIEGSRDGTTWLAYEFRWKPGDVTRIPRFVAPHQPRLDWQMWFAALGPRNAHWLGGLLLGLLEGSPAIVELLGEPPFPEGPPAYVRLAYYDYRFTTPGEKRETGAWWRREFRGYLTEALSLESFAR